MPSVDFPESLLSCACYSSRGEHVQVHVPPPQPGVLLRPGCPEPPVFNPKHAVSSLNRIAYRSSCPQAPEYSRPTRGE